MRLGDMTVCSVCGRDGIVVSTDGSDYDLKLRRSVPKTLVAVEPSAFEPPGLTCEDCERLRLKAALPTRGRCAWCGKPAKRSDLASGRSFCNDDCISAFLTAREAGLE